VEASDDAPAGIEHEDAGVRQVDDAGFAGQLAWSSWTRSLRRPSARITRLPSSDRSGYVMPCVAAKSFRTATAS
jgi:hypothetical protein